MHHLVVRVGALGDVLLTRRLTCSLGRAGGQITLFAPARHAALLAADPWVERVLDSESPEYTGVFTGRWPETGGGPRFDAAFVISKVPEIAKAAQAVAARVIGVSPSPAGESRSIARQWAEAALEAGVAPFEGPMPSLPVEAEAALAPGLTILHAGSGSTSKNWRTERFAELGRRLEDDGHQVVWLRGPAELDPEETVPSPFPSIDRPPLATLAATLARARLFIGNDSGVSHLAAATGAPTLVLFGPTPAPVWRPDGPRVQTVSSPSGAMEDLPLDVVLDAARDVARLSPTGRP